jgi:hypothetical protein
MEPKKETSAKMPENNKKPYNTPQIRVYRTFDEAKKAVSREGVLNEFPRKP